MIVLLSSLIFSEEVKEADDFKTDNFYVGYGGSVSNADESLVECRASLKGIVGYSFNDYFQTEVRYDHGLGGHYRNIGVYIKPTYAGFYGLLGYGQANYIDHNLQYAGGRVGVGYSGILDFFSVDVVNQFEEEDWVVSIYHTYKF